MTEKLLEVKNLKKHFKVKNGLLHAVDDISFSINKGETLGVVGESGCGKSTTGRLVIKLLEPTEGEIFFEGKDINKYNKNDMRSIRRQMQIIFQDPYASINPRMTVSEIIGESLKIHKIVKTREEMDKKIGKLMETVGLSQRLYNAYPHELDGGRRQRIGIARALSVDPKFIVCDEPVSALDVSIQAQILNLMMDLQKEFDLTYMFITHDLSVVKHISDNIAVMYLGQLVELAPSKELFKNPVHPYTQALLSAIPVANLKKKKERIILRGEITSPINPKPGCRFANRCIYASEACKIKDNQLIEVSPNHFVACEYMSKSNQ